MRLLVAALVVIVVLVLFNLPQLTSLEARAAAPSGTAPQPPQNFSGAQAPLSNRSAGNLGLS